jgi:hypothetical protein
MHTVAARAPHPRPLSPKRGEGSQRDPSSHAYDLDPVGLVYVELSRDDYKTKLESAADAVYKSKQSLEQMFAYDTAGYGRSNQGHTFSDSLTQTARRLLPRTSRPVCPNPEDPGGPRSESSLNRPNGSVAYQRRSDQNERLIATEGSVSIWLAR